MQENLRRVTTDQKFKKYQQYVYVCIYGNQMYLLLQWWLQVLTCIITLRIRSVISVKYII